MTKKTHKANAVSSDKLFVIGLDDSGKPRGARFAECDNRVVNAALDMRLSCIHPASTVFAELAMKLPQGRLYASGKTFVPNIRRDLYDKLTAILAQAGDTSQVLKLQKAPDQSGQASGTPGKSVACISPAIAGLPRSWASVGVGHMVLVHESAEDGWWEAVVIAREDEVLTLRFRDYPKQPTFVRHLSTVALVNPGPD